MNAALLHSDQAMRPRCFKRFSATFVTLAHRRFRANEHVASGENCLRSAEVAIRRNTLKVCTGTNNIVNRVSLWLCLNARNRLLTIAANLLTSKFVDRYKQSSACLTHGQILFSKCEMHVKAPITELNSMLSVLGTIACYICLLSLPAE